MGKWYVDGQSLSTYAFNVRNRGASWKVAAKRGENLVVPGRSGSRHSPRKPSGDGTVGLEMWAVGALPDGSMPKTMDARTQTLRHLDRLSQVFGTDRLIELVRTEDDTVDYGRRNELPNPGMDTVSEQIVLDVNAVPNASFEDATAVETVTRTNIATNPIPTLTSPTRTIVRTNAALDPQMTNVASLYTAPGSGLTYAIDTTLAYTGTTSARFTYASAPSAPVEAMIGPAIPMQATQVAAVSMRMRLKAGMSAKSVTLSAHCLDSNGASLGYLLVPGTESPMFTVAEINASGWTEVKFPGGAMRPGTTSLLPVIVSSTGFVANDAFHVDAVLVERALTTGSYFDGGTAATSDGLTHAWAGTENASASTEGGMSPTSWLSGATPQPVMADLGGTQGKVMRTLRPPLDTSVFEVNHLVRQDTGTLPAGKVSGSIEVRHPRAVQVRAVHRFFNGSTPVHEVQGDLITLVPNTWTRIGLADLDVPGPWTSDYTGVRVAGVREAGDYLDSRRAIVVRDTTTGSYFDGTSGTGYRWKDGVVGGASEAFSLGVAQWTPTAYASNTGGLGAAIEGASQGTTPRPILSRVPDGATDGASAMRLTSQRASGWQMARSGLHTVEGFEPMTGAVDVTVQQNCTVVMMAGVVSTSPVPTSSLKVEEYPMTAGQTLRVKATTPGIPDSRVAIGYVMFGLKDAAVGATALFEKVRLGYEESGVYRNASSPGWTTDSTFGTPVRYGTGIEFWRIQRGSMVRSGDWSLSRDHSGLLVANGGSPAILTPRDYPLKGYDTAFPVDATQQYVFAVTVRAREACTVRVGLRPGKRVAAGLDYRPTIFGQSVSFLEGEEKRVHVVGVPSTDGTVTHALPELHVSDPNTLTTVSAGVGIWLDDAVFARGADPAYFDGASPWVKWEGEPYRSSSVVYGPARRAMVEVTSAIDMDSMAGGTRAEFAVEGIIPTTYWEDTWVTEQSVPIITSGQIILLDSLEGNTAPIEDAVIEINRLFAGTTYPFRITDLASGGWIEITKTFTSSGAPPLIIDNDQWTVTHDGASQMRFVKHGGHSRLLPLTMDTRDRAPRLLVTGTITSGMVLKVKARRRYHIA